MRAHRLGLEVVDHPLSPPPRSTTTELENSEELLFVQEALKILAAALKVAGKQGLDNLEIQRLNVVDRDFLGL